MKGEYHILFIDGRRYIFNVSRMQIGILITKNADVPVKWEQYAILSISIFHFSISRNTNWILFSLYFELFCFLVDWFVWNVWHKFNRILRRNHIFSNSSVMSIFESVFHMPCQRQKYIYYIWFRYWAKINNTIKIICILLY